VSDVPLSTPAEMQFAIDALAKELGVKSMNIEAMSTLESIATGTKGVIYPKINRISLPLEFNSLTKEAIEAAAHELLHNDKGNRPAMPVKLKDAINRSGKQQEVSYAVEEIAGCYHADKGFRWD